MPGNVEAYKLRGFTRVQLVDRKTGRVIGDTGYVRNKIQARGFEQMIVNNVAGSGTQRNPLYLQLGSFTGTPTSANFDSMNTQAGQASQNGMASASRSYVTTSDGGILRLTAEWKGSDYITGADESINAIAMFNATNETGSALAGATFSSSSWSSDQDVRATYELRFTQT